MMGAVALRQNWVFQMRVSRTKLFWVGCCLLLTGSAAFCHAQTQPAKSGTLPPSANASSPAPDYSEEAYVVEKFDRVYDFHSDGTWKETTTAKIRVQSQAGIQLFGDLSRPYESDNQRVKIIYVRVIAPDGTTTETPASNIQDLAASVTLSAPVYSDLRVKQIPVTNLIPGDTIEYEFQTTEFRPEVPNQFWLSLDFLTDNIVLDERVQVRVPKDKYVKVASATVKPTVREEDGEKVYEWKTSRWKKEDGNDATDKKRKKSKDERPSIQITTFKSWKQVGEWYRSLVASRAAVTPAIRQKEQEITAGLTTDSAKQRAIYSYVSTQIRYIALSFGIGRLQPHSADTVLQNKYGDCKDKHTLFAAMMKAAGYQVWPALIGAGIQLDPDVPSPGQFNHLISVLPDGKSLTWLDTTEEVAPFGMLTRTLRDKQALVMPVNSDPSLKKTPAHSLYPEWYGFTIAAALSDKDILTGHVKMKLRGDPELAFREGFRATPRGQWKDLAQGISDALRFNGKVSRVQANDPDNTEKPFQFQYDYVEKNYSGSDSPWISPPLPPIFFSYGENDTPPADRISLGSVGVRDLRATVQLPPGETAKVPADADIKTRFAEYQETAAFKAGVLTFERRFTAKTNHLPTSKWNDYLKFEKAVRARENQMTQLVSAKTSATEKAKAPTKPVDNPKAGDLIKKANNAIQKGHLAEAEKDLRQAQALNPNQLYLWGNWSQIQLRRQQADKALASLEREYANHPAKYGDMSKESRKANAAIEVGQEFLSRKNYPEAGRILKIAAEAKPPALSTYQIAWAHVQYGHAEIKLGHRNKGIAELETALHSAQLPWQINTAAYYLAQNETDLPDALTYAKKALPEIEKDTSQINLAKLGEYDMGRVDTMGRLWDTIGWLEFKLGHNAEADTYASAAWRLLQHGEVADHLGQINEKEGKPEQALQMYRLALAAGDLEDSKTTSQRLKALEVKFDQKEPSDPKGPEAELVKLTTFSVPVSTPWKNPVSAHFLVQVNRNGVKDAKFLTGDKLLQSAEDQLKKVDFHPVFPDNGPEEIVWEGLLSCLPYASSCSFTLALH